MEPRIMTVTQAAKLAGVSRWRIYEMIKRGRITPLTTSPITILVTDEKVYVRGKPGQGRPRKEGKEREKRPVGRPCKPREEREKRPVGRPRNPRE